MKFPEDVPVGAYVPPILRSATIVPSDCTFTARYNKNTKLINYKYEITWNELHESLDRAEERDDSFHKVEAIEPKVMCDGVCKKKHKPKKLSQRGRCGHYLCVPCSTLVKNPDGTDGCSAWQCYRSAFGWESEQQAKKYYETRICASKERDKLQPISCCASVASVNKSPISSSPLATSTPISKPSHSVSLSQDVSRLQRSSSEPRSYGNTSTRAYQYEMLLVKILEHEVIPINRRHTKMYEEEVGGEVTLEKCLNEIIGPRPLKDGQVFLLTKEYPSKKHVLFLINKEANRGLPLYKLASIGGKPEIQIAIDYSGQMRSKKVL
ncbi:unnamed protein product, partial [Mesorhabditis belari]|uniref:Uncharacterized protein n=1 Tax=Mesorhabditis belari TaxID=2138241 RepID=A0AAF3F0C2_9BILA